MSVFGARGMFGNERPAYGLSQRGEGLVGTEATYRSPDVAFLQFCRSPRHRRVIFLTSPGTPPPPLAEVEHLRLVKAVLLA